MNFAAALRRELADRARQFAEAHGLSYTLSYAETPIVCFAPFADGSRHGNFLNQSYRAIRANSSWNKRLTKVHTQGHHSLPRNERGRWMELDTSASSDALLMNIFCHPDVLQKSDVPAFLGVDRASACCFGYRARVPLVNGRFDRTEVDLRIGDLLIEAKLSEGDFQSADKSALVQYRDFADVFDRKRLPQTKDCYISYQLLRNVLAAHALQCSFSVLVDARRPDLADAWYEVMKCVRPVELRTKLRISTWQELAAATPKRVREFLEAKYGIVP